MRADYRARYGDAKVDAQLDALRRHGDTIDDPDVWLGAALAGDFKFMAVERVAACCCGSADSEALVRFIFWNLLGLRRCRSCGTLFVSPRLSPEAMRRVFDTSYFDHADIERWGRRREPIFDDAIRILRGIGARSVFDVGTAYGHFVAAALAAGLDAEGCDVSPSAIRRGRAELGVRLREGTVASLEPPLPVVDCVTSFDALYYTADPVQELRGMRRLLRPGGYLLLRLRNAEHARVAPAREIGRSALPVEHLWGFTPRSIARPLERAGFQIVSRWAAPYSRTRLSGLQQLWWRMGQVSARVRPHAPLLTQSFTIVARALPDP